MKTFKLTVTEGELEALIFHHSRIIQNAIENEEKVSVEVSQRIHDLTKRLNKETAEIEPIETNNTQTEATEETKPSGW